MVIHPAFVSTTRRRVPPRRRRCLEASMRSHVSSIARRAARRPASRTDDSISSIRVEVTSTVTDTVISTGLTSVLRALFDQRVSLVLFFERSGTVVGTQPGAVAPFPGAPD